MEVHKSDVGEAWPLGDVAWRLKLKLLDLIRTSELRMPSCMRLSDSHALRALQYVEH